jgi:putative membrane protein
MWRMLWIKALHIIFVASWFAGLFYLPRLYVNLALVAPDSHVERERLLLMARKLYQFTNFLMVPGFAFGILLWLKFGIGKEGPGNGWLHAKLGVVGLALVFQYTCRRFLYEFEQLKNRRTHVFYRIFNEISVVLFATVVILVVVKPF